jgi:hypothetical protein
MYWPQVYAVYNVSVTTEASSAKAVQTGIYSGLSTGVSANLNTYPPVRTVSFAEEVNNPKVNPWFGVGVAFVLVFGLQTIGVCVLFYELRKAKAAARAAQASPVVVVSPESKMT